MKNPKSVCQQALSLFEVIADMLSFTKMNRLSKREYAKKTWNSVKLIDYYCEDEYSYEEQVRLGTASDIIEYHTTKR
jgi:hypothetical protein